MNILFNKNHRLRVPVTSSSAPGFGPKPNTGEPFGENTCIRLARNSVYGTADHPSYLLPSVVHEGVTEY